MELKDFQLVHLLPGEKKETAFSVTRDYLFEA